MVYVCKLINISQRPLHFIFCGVGFSRQLTVKLTGVSCLVQNMFLSFFLRHPQRHNMACPKCNLTHRLPLSVRRLAQMDGRLWKGRGLDENTTKGWY